MTQPTRSLRLQKRSTRSLDTLSGSVGEIFYDSESKALRLYTESLGRSVTLADRTWVLNNTFDGNYSSLTNVPTIPSINGLATETFVTDAVAGFITIDDVNVDLSTIGVIGDVDVATTPLVDGQILQYDGVNWVNVTLAGVEDTNTTYTLSGVNAAGGGSVDLRLTDVGGNIDTINLLAAGGLGISVTSLNEITITGSGLLPLAGGTLTGGLNVTSGKVGIGTDAPDETLDVRGTVGVGYINGGMLRLYNQAHSNYSSIRNTKNTAAGLDANMQFHDSTGFVMLIEGGNVGIGTAGPDARLHIDVKDDNGLIVQNSTSQSSGQNTEVAIRFKVTASANAIRAKAGIHFKNDGSAFGRGDLHFAVDSNDDDGNVDINDSKMVITHEGNVGIGVVPTTDTLEVAGTVKFTGSLTVNGTTTLQQTTEIVTPPWHPAHLAPGAIVEYRSSDDPFVGSTGTVTDTRGVVYHTIDDSAGAANWTANFSSTLLPTTAWSSKSLAIVCSQGSTNAWLPTAVQIGGVAQTIQWQGNIPPTGTVNGVDIISFTFIRRASDWLVLGSGTSYS